MRVIIESNSDKFIGLALLLSMGDLDQLTARLTELKAEPDQHFHLSTDGHEGPFVDLEISVDPGHSTNAAQSGFAIKPDDPPA